MPNEGARAVQEEFDRAAEGFAERTQGRFDDMDVVAFSRVAPDETALEVGAGTGNFLALFKGHAARLIAFDLTAGMLAQARRHGSLELTQGDAHALPFATRSIDLVMTAQALHHIHDPVPVLKEMRRVVTDGGRVLIVDQHAPESYEQSGVMNELEVLRDPTHAMSRPPSAFRVMVQAAGLTIVDEKLWTGKNRFSRWMWPEEFPEERIAAVRAFIQERGHETGMEFERDGDDWVFTRRRMMILATR